MGCESQCGTWKLIVFVKRLNDFKSRDKRKQFSDKTAFSRECEIVIGEKNFAKRANCCDHE